MEGNVPNLGKTQDGFSWTPHQGTKKGGFSSKGVISPAQRVVSPESFVYDCIVIGAGYAGLSASRDLKNAGWYLP